jgi:uncharacterized membrane protein
MILTFWPFLALIAAFISALAPVIQERRPVDGFAVALWSKIILVIVLAPIVIFFLDLPNNPLFYLSCLVSALIWSICDVIYWRNIPIVGAGVVSRLIPSSVVLTFVAWFVIEPSLFNDYLQKPVQFSLLTLIVLFAVFCATQLKNCAISWDGFRRIWFVIFAASCGTMIDKLILGQSPAKLGPFAFAFVQGCFMVGFWGIWALIKKPVNLKTFFARNTLVTTLPIGLCATIVVMLKFYALKGADHPALVSIIFFTDAVWILMLYRMLGRRETAHIWAGLGIVLAAILLILTKSFVTL